MTDKYVAYCNAVAGGMFGYKAYIEFVAEKKDISKETAKSGSARLMKRKEIRQQINDARKARGEAITLTIAREVAAEFSTTHLTIDELDSYHMAIIQGKVFVEEVIPQWTSTEILDKEGRVVKRQRVQNFVRVSRPANIRERQISIDAIYKRHGSYAASRLFAAVKHLDDDGLEDNVERMVLLADGTKIPLLPEAQQKTA